MRGLHKGPNNLAIRHWLVGNNRLGVFTVWGLVVVSAAGVV